MLKLNQEVDELTSVNNSLAPELEKSKTNYFLLKKEASIVEKELNEKS
jgi:hypothetical protein